MYDEIFDDFNTIKRHCEHNGNIKFEESAVFDLLEDLQPHHGSAHAIQMILDMLDVQRINDDDRNSKNVLDEPGLEILNDKSNDTDSIIEVEVPRKIHPYIDLTSNSPESDEPVICETKNKNSINQSLENDNDTFAENDSSESYDDYPTCLSDSDVSKPFEEDWNSTADNIMRSKNRAPLIDFLDVLDESNIQSNLNQFEFIEPNNQSTLNTFAESNVGITADASEMLEENNNDPNNNLDGRIFDEETRDVNNSNDIIPGVLNFQDSGNSSSNDFFVDSVINPMPGCSKDTEININRRINNRDLPHTIVRGSSSPVPGCSKDFNNSSGFESCGIDFDESIQNDSICIQEIVRWADLETICSILKKYGNSPNRKQLTLWDLMSKESKSTPVSSKRKVENDTCPIIKKIPKAESLDEIDEIIMGIEYSNDSLSSKVSVNESTSEVTETNQNEQISEGNESSKIILKEKESKNSNSTEFSLTPLNNKSNILMDEVANLIPTNIKVENPSVNVNQSSVYEAPKNTLPLPEFPLAYVQRPVKKEKNETIVSGWLTHDVYVGPLPVKKVPPNNIYPLNSDNSFNKQSVNISNSLEFNDINKLDNDSDKIKIEQIKKKIERSVNIFEKEQIKKLAKTVSSVAKIMVEGLPNDNDEKSNQDRIELIKPPKLLLSRVSSTEYAIKNTPTTYIRPATFNYNGDPNLKRSSTGMILPQINNAARSSKLQSEILGRLVGNNHVATSTSTLKPSKLNLIAMRTPQHPMPLIRDNGPKHTITSSMAKVIQAQQRPGVVINPNAILPSRSGQTTTKNAAVLTVPKIAVIHNVPTTSNTRIDIPEVPNVPTTSDTLTASNASTSSDSTTTSNVLNYSYEVPEHFVSVYHKLRSIFPEVRKSYVKKICANPPVPMQTKNTEFVLNVLIDHLLKEGHNHSRPVQNYVEQFTVNTMSVDEQYENLLGIFPNADPTYLRNFVEKNNSQQVLEEFIQRNLESHDYPTKEQYLAKIKITEQAKQYTFDFKVENFLELFSDPFKHFEDESRKCLYDPIAMEFLKSFFNRNKVNTISRQYTTNKYNLSLTAKTLTTMGPDMKSKRMSSEMPTENIPLLQELAFIKNKNNIQNHINTLKAKEEELFKQLQEKNLLIECQCCFNDECMPTKCSECNEGHVFCYDCIIRGTESTLADGQCHVRCFSECTSEFSIATLQKVLPPTKFSALLKKRQAAEVMAADVEGLVSCPFCHFASIPPPEDKVFKCLNTECMKETCRQCKELNHVPLKCDEVIKTDKARLLIEEKMTEALLRTCYKCKLPFYKEEGCNKMRCSCGALMCYVCDKPVKDYSHFNAQGGVNSKLCPLWCDDRRLNAEAVRKVAEDTKNAILKNNPNLHIDTDKLLPKLPPKSRGAHDDIPNANQLPEHVRRIAGAAP